MESPFEAQDVQGRGRRWLLRGILAAAFVGLFLGWQVFRFLCDDAYIGFRYVGNAIAGFGLTWNPAPFQPVEGYTSFLWELLLLGAWKVTGLDPTRTATQLGLLCAIGSVVYIWRMAQAIPLAAPLERWRPAWVALVLLGTLSNRTFLAWTSGGLETPLYVLLVLGWVDAVARRRYFAVSIHAVLLTLCRPDGIVLLAASLPVLLLDWRRVRPWVVLPMIVVPIHLWWRHATYGFWFPNTYYAKVTGAFIESGWRYLGSWMLEYAWWILLAIGLVAGILMFQRMQRWQLQGWHFAVAGLLANAAWYTLWVGGDYFEFRIYAHFVPLAWLALLGILGWMRASPRATLAALAAQLLLSLPIPWMHWALTPELFANQQKGVFSVRVAHHLPAGIRPYVDAFDEMQAWLSTHLVCVRQQEHADFVKYQVARLPPRPATESVVKAWTDPKDIPVMFLGATGTFGWALPEFAILDGLGLNDAVVARNPELRPGRKMTHERCPPAGYVECFRPNVTFKGGQLLVTPREHPLGPAEVVAAERDWWEKMGIAPLRREARFDVGGVVEAGERDRPTR